MNMPDSRIPVVFGTLAEAGAGDALLLAGDAPAPPGRVVGRVAGTGAAHAPGCNCCVSRSGAAQAMAALFVARARGDVVPFPRLFVALDATGVAAARAALTEDRFVAGRYRAFSNPRPGTPAAGAHRASASG